MINYDDHNQTWFFIIYSNDYPAFGKYGYLSYNECLLARDIHLATTGEAL